MKLPLPKGKIEIKFGKEVYSPLRTSIDTLVLAEWFILDGYKVVDVGCGSGYLGLGIKKMFPLAEVTLVDKFPDSLETTRKNAKLNKLEVNVQKGDLLEGIQGVDMIIANLPTYSEEQIQTTPLYGPISAYLDEKKLVLYTRLFKQAQTALNPGGYLIIECQSTLQRLLPQLAEETNFHLLTRNTYGFAFINPIRVVNSTKK